MKALPLPGPFDGAGEVDVAGRELLLVSSCPARGSDPTRCGVDLGRGQETGVPQATEPIFNESGASSGQRNPRSKGTRA